MPRQPAMGASALEAFIADSMAVRLPLSIWSFLGKSNELCLAPLGSKWDCERARNKGLEMNLSGMLSPLGGSGWLPREKPPPDLLAP